MIGEPSWHSFFLVVTVLTDTYVLVVSFSRASMWALVAEMANSCRFSLVRRELRAASIASWSMVASPVRRQYGMEGNM